MDAYINFIPAENGKFFEAQTVLYGSPIDSEKIVPCSSVKEKCDVKYPYFPCWQCCGHSYIELNGMIACKNYGLIEKALGLDLDPKKDKKSRTHS